MAIGDIHRSKQFCKTLNQLVSISIGFKREELVTFGTFHHDLPVLPPLPLEIPMLPNPGRNENMECASQSRRFEIGHEKVGDFARPFCASFKWSSHETLSRNVKKSIESSLVKKYGGDDLNPSDPLTRLSAKVIGTPMECIKPTCRLSSWRCLGDVQI